MILAPGIATEIGPGVAKVLFQLLGRTLAFPTLEGSHHEFGTNFGRSSNGTLQTDQTTDIFHAQLPNGMCGGHVEKGHKKGNVVISL